MSLVNILKNGGRQSGHFEHLSINVLNIDTSKFIDHEKLLTILDTKIVTLHCVQMKIYQFEISIGDQIEKLHLKKIISTLQMLFYVCYYICE